MLIYKKATYKPVIIVEYSSGDTQMSKNAILKALVHDFSEGVWINVLCWVAKNVNLWNFVSCFKIEQVQL